MNALAAVGGRWELTHHARRCRSMGSPFIADVLEATDRHLVRAPMTEAMIMGWPGDPAADAVAMRVNGALHALARRGTPQHLADLYSGSHDDFDGAIVAALSQEDQFISDWIRFPPQTNEVARAAGIMSALMAAPLARPMPFELLELGSSCGLNLNLGRYAYTLGSATAGDPLSAVRIEPDWRGPTPAVAPVSIAAARGVDLQPLSASNPTHRERLQSFAWADRPARSKRLEEALQIAVEHPPWIDQSDAATWLEQRLAEPQPEGRCRVVVHSMFLQYLSARERQAMTAMIASAGARATENRPLIRIAFEWTEERSEVQLRLSAWPTGKTVVLAKCDPYGEWVEWLRPEDRPSR